MSTSLIERPVFDHCYRSIVGDEVFQNLAGRGFLLNPEPVIHPERLKCQFLHFLSLEGIPVYLEFYFRDETLPKIGPEKVLDPAGFALRSPSNLDEVYEQFQDKHSTLNPNLVHRNYQRTANEDERLPGWNFLIFGNPPLSDIDIWLIEYEQVPGRSQDEIDKKRKKRADLVLHPNGARQVLGFIWKGSDPSDFMQFVAIASANYDGSKISISGKTVVHTLTEADHEAQ